jgi:RHS repeat-associated protein
VAGSIAFSSTALGVSAVASSVSSAAQQWARTPRGHFTDAPRPAFLGKRPGRDPASRGGLWSAKARRFADSSAEHRAEPPLMASTTAGYAVIGHTLAVSADSGSSESWEGSFDTGDGSVNTGNGNKLTSLNLLSWKVRGGMTLDFTLYHNSQTSYNDELGHGWTWTYDVYVNNLSGNPVVHFGDGTSVPYTAPGGTGGGGGELDPGMTDVPAEYLVASTAMAAALPYYQGTATTYTAPVGIYDSLVKNADSTWTLTKKSGTKYLFNTAGFLTKVQDRNSNAITLTLNSGNYVTKITDPTGRYVDVSVDSSGNFQSVADHTGRTWSFTRNGSDDLTTVTWPVLDATTYTDGFAYNAGHDITTRTDKRGKAWTSVYNSDGSVASETDPLGHATTYTYASGYTEIANALNKKVRHNYSGGVLASVVDEANFSESYTSRDTNKNVLTKVDRRGKTWTYTYDAKGNALTAKDPLLHTDTFTYNGFSQVLTAKDALNDTTTNTYDANGNLLTVTDPLNKVLATNVYGTYGLLQSTTDATNRTTTFGYDANGLPSSVTDPASKVSTVAYDPLSRVTDTTDALGKTTTVQYDAWGRAVKTLFPSTLTSGVRAFTQTAYNAEGQVTGQTDELNRTTTHAYDDAGRLTSTTNPRGDVESYGYDVADRRTSTTNGRGKTRTYTFTDRGEVATLTLPDGAVETWSYNGNGQTSGYTNPLNETILYPFDDAGRQTGVDYPTGTDTAFGYDNADRRTSMTDATGTTTWGYDAASRQTSLSAPQGGQTYTYDDAGRRLTMVQTSGTTSYAYDTAGRLQTLTNPLGEVTTSAYDDAGRKTRETWHNGAYSDFGYDARDRMKTIVRRKSDGVGSLGNESYSYDDAGNLTSRTVYGVATGFAYDAADQLLSETTGADVTGYTYDGNGNRLTKTVNGVVEGYSYDDGDKLLSAGGKSYTYDAAGRTKTVVSSAGTTTLNYDYEGRVTGIQYPNLSTNTFAYNGLDTRVSKVDSTGTFSFKRDGAGVTAPVLSDGAASYTPGVSERRGTTTRYYAQDHQGSVNRQVRPDQTTSTSRRWDAFGNLLTTTATSPPATPFGYAGGHGYQEDKDSGLKLLGHRYYDPSTGRFLTRDPIKDGRNWYGYCKNNPLKWIDDDGKQAKKPTITIRAGRQALGHSWIIVDWGNGKREKTEITAPLDVIDNTDLGRRFDDERTLPFDPKKFPTLESMKPANRDYNLFTNNCTTYAELIWRRVTGERLHHRRRGLPSDPDQLSLGIKDANEKDKKRSRKG